MIVGDVATDLETARLVSDCEVADGGELGVGDEVELRDVFVGNDLVGDAPI